MNCTKLTSEIQKLYTTLYREVVVEGKENRLIGMERWKWKVKGSMQPRGNDWGKVDFSSRKQGISGYLVSNKAICVTPLRLKGAKALAETIKSVGGFAPEMELNLGGNAFGDEGAIAIAEAIKIVGFAPGMRLKLNDNMIGNDGAKALVEAIISVGGFAPGMTLYLYGNRVGDEGLKALIEAIKEVGFAPRMRLDFRVNLDIGDECKQILQDLKDYLIKTGQITDPDQFLF